MKKKRTIKIDDEIVNFSDNAEDETQSLKYDETVSEFEDNDSQQLVDDSFSKDETAEEELQQNNSEEYENYEEYEYTEESDKKPLFLSGIFEKLKKKHVKTPENEERPQMEEVSVTFEKADGTIIDIDADELSEREETDFLQNENDSEPEKNNVVINDEDFDKFSRDEALIREKKKEPVAYDPEKPVEYAKTKDDLPSAEQSDDVYADIVKNIDDSVHKQRTSRQEKYEREQSFAEAENPFQRNRDKPLQGEESLSYEDIHRKELKTFDEIFDNIKSKIFPRKGEKKIEIIRKIVANTSIVVLVCCAIAFGVLYIQSKKAEKQQLGLSSQIVDITSAEEEEQLWEDFRAKYPHIKTPEGMMAKYAYLYAINQKLVGWISIPNSGVNVQVVQSNDNKDYLKKDFYGNYSRYGCPFMDYRNDSRYLNQNTIIYGHHMSDGLIFAELSKYKDLDGFLESPIICFDTLYKTYSFKIYAAIITNTREEDDNGYVFNYTVTSFASSQNFDAFIAAVDERKLYTTGVDINSGDKLITLSTCTYEFNDARLVIIGRMLRTGETIDIDTTYATKNGNPHYPQVWYDKNGKSNPFIGATKWYPEG